MYKILAALFLVFFVTSAYAQDEETKNYYRAYNVCSPAAQSQTMKDCNYQKMVENFYIGCMRENGFSDSDDMDQARYAEYLKTYKQCSATANSSAQKQCNYGSNFQSNYNKCMKEAGYDQNGERINKRLQEVPKNYNSQMEDEEPNENGFLAKFLESIL